MSQQQHHHTPAPHGPAYETTDADTKQITVWTTSIFITIALGLISMAALLFAFVKFPAPLDRPPTAAEYERTLPPTPRLQVNQSGDLRDFREHEESVMSTYSREANSGAVRMPINTAIEVIAARGVLPGSKPLAVPVAAAPAKK